MARSYAPAVHTARYFAQQEQRNWTGDQPGVPPQWVLDAAAEAVMHQGWNIKAGNVCGSCHTARTVTGSCYC